jgi:4-hydroxy-tetrahydrodipicolinate synthase
MRQHIECRGVVVPIVTPVTPAGELDEAALDRLIEFLLAGGVDGIFVLGTTGEGPSVPRSTRAKLVDHTLAAVSGKVPVYAGIGGTCLADSVAAGNEYFRAGADVVVAQPPVYFPLQPRELLAYFEELLDGLAGPLILYNIPATTRVSIPLDVVAELQGHPNLAGMKDSENDPKRLEELIRRFGGEPTFSIFIGVGSFMAKGLKLGAEGLVPSVGNLIPEVCSKLCARVARGDWAEADRQADRMSAVSAMYQQNRTLGQSLAALKAALHWRGVCGPDMLPPLLPLTHREMEALREEMLRLNLLDGTAR